MSAKDYLSQLEKNKPQYQKSQELINQQQLLKELEKNKPQAYKSQYSQNISDKLDSIMNREKFSYDFNADPLFKQALKSNAQQGQMAMRDTMGNASALSGGYGNSYAQTVGQQVYNANVDKTYDMLPALQQAAYGRYQDEGNKLNNDLAILQNLDATDYAKYRDDVSDYRNELNYMFTKTNTMSDREYNYYKNNLAAWQHDRTYYYGKVHDEDVMAFQKHEAERNQKNLDRDYALKQQSAKRSSSGGSRGRSSSKSKNKSSSKKEPLYYEDKNAGLKAYYKQKGRAKTIARINEMSSKGEINHYQMRALLDDMKKW